jgi:hypothetical protein
VKLDPLLPVAGTTHCPVRQAQRWRENDVAGRDTTRPVREVASCSNCGTRAYPDYFARCIHKGVEASEGAAVAVELSQSARGESHSYLVDRRWSDSGKGVQEQVSVWKSNSE